METYDLEGFRITLEKEGSRRYDKVSYPLRYGSFAEISASPWLFHFNLNGEIKFIQGSTPPWPHPAEWLKRTAGNDWVYYSAGDYRGIYDLFGEYYFPCLSYPTNQVMDEAPFNHSGVLTGFRAWSEARKRIKRMAPLATAPHLRNFLTSLAIKDRRYLQSRAAELHEIIGGPVSVLPPESRHVDYDVIPVLVADGCFYHCRFCCIKSGQDYRVRTKDEIRRQIMSLKAYHGRDLANWSAVFLGLHDALGAGREVLQFAASESYDAFGLASRSAQPKLFLFATVDSLLRSSAVLFESLNDLPFSTYINVGLESADPETLAFLGKPLSAERVSEAFHKIMEVNRLYPGVEVSANFIFGFHLPDGHWSSFLDLTSRPPRDLAKGSIYLSPLASDEKREANRKREMLRMFYGLKSRSRFPLYLYLIQRL